ncbi:MAG: B12 lower ligand biosynthesis radical SAM protein BzaD [Thermodesulfovibrionales bacterium]
MRVLFIQTPSIEGPSQERVYPIGIIILAGSLLRSGYDVEILDMNIETDPFGAMKKKLLSFRPDVVGLSLRNIDPLANKTSSLVPPFLVTARLVASIMPESWLIAGGTGFSLFPERLMREAPEIHYGIRGEAEISLPLLLASLENPPLIKGLCTRRGKAVRITAPSKCLDMAHCAPPDRSLLNPSLYAGLNTYVPSIGIETKRGCPFHCTYCVYPMLQGKRLRCRSPREVVDEMESLNKEYGIERFHFTDPIVNFPDAHLEDICREILRRRLKLKWDGFMREDYFDEKNAALFEKAGCECFSFSPDGLCQDSLDVLGKRLTERDVLRAAALAARTDVISVYHFMVNVPGETEKTCEKGLRFLERLYDKHSRKKNLGTVVLNNIRVLPGTPIEARARASGAIGPETDLLYPTYYNPKPFDAFRYRLEALHLCRNVFMWQEVR